MNEMEEVVAAAAPLTPAAQARLAGAAIRIDRPPPIDRAALERRFDALFAVA
jgi:hypothetical protein